ncbi:hypothetical protein RRG08_059330 [Elysia crispata]|uniref:Uncharacterized protein n=1 Tax=Elysia crispata TaxID=231223 RepID=A0AAE1EF49_9GAST|nr:hypothetical protein RRG08_059330 [Elysia crispata]
MESRRGITLQRKPWEFVITNPPSGFDGAKTWGEESRRKTPPGRGEAYQRPRLPCPASGCAKIPAIGGPLTITFGLPRTRPFPAHQRPSGDRYGQPRTRTTMMTVVSEAITSCVAGAELVVSI